MAIRQRKKGSHITFDGNEEPIPLPWAKQTNSELPIPPPDLTLYIRALPQDWRALYHLGETDPEYLGQLLFIKVIKPVYERFLVKEDYSPPRGVHAEPEDQENPYALGLREQFMWEARNYTAAAYTVLSHWGQKPRDEWPQIFKLLIEEVSADIGTENVFPSKKKEIDVIAVVVHLFKEKFNKRRKRLSLKDPGEMTDSDFRDNYLWKNHLEAARTIYNNREQLLTVEELYDLMS